MCSVRVVKSALMWVSGWITGKNTFATTWILCTSVRAARDLFLLLMKRKGVIMLGRVVAYFAFRWKVRRLSLLFAENLAVLADVHLPRADRKRAGKRIQKFVAKEIRKL
jgi:hypothetical protein